MSANDIQVGGDHYAGKFQHWDMVTAYGNPYLEGAATKYISRWRKKNGLQDLRKAEHFILKLREEATAGRIQPNTKIPVVANAIAFCEAHSLGTYEAIAVVLIMEWRTLSHIDIAARAVRRLIEDYLAAEPTAQYVDQG